ncbi:hypothetical protein BDW69DRAFT_176679 [Aspergillus filifer]
MRSRTGCLTCRTRKLKCDEAKPVCTQCQKGGRECRPSEGVVFRHQQNASMNEGSSDGCGGLRGFYSYKNTFDKDSVWLEIPKHVVFVDNSDPYAQDLESALSESEAAILAANSQNAGWDAPQIPPPEREETQGLEALSTIATHDRLPYPGMVVDQPSVPTTDSVTTPFNPIPTTVPGPHLNGPNQIPRPMPAQISPPISIHSDNGSNTNIHFLLNPSQSISPPIDPIIQRTPDSSGSPLAVRSSDLSMDGHAETDYEVTFLLRHFSEVLGPWMDLYDFGTHFASHVPVQALRNPLLKYAACAQAAKQIGHVNVARPVGVRLSRTFPGAQNDAKKIDWCWKGAKYYEKAIQLLMKELQPGRNQGNKMNEENDPQRARSYTEYRLSHGVRSDEILAATAILSVYELLDATGPAWNRHLSGFKSLLDLAEAGMRPLQRPPPGDLSLQPKRPSLSKARKATFWNFARQDYLAAFINGNRTRLHTEDLALWTEAGLQVDTLGFVRANANAPDEIAMKEDTISNALVWIISKIINFISPSSNAQISPTAANAGSMSLPQQVRLERWYRLESELDAWYKGLPETFQPCARIGLPEGASPGETDDAPSLSEIWYSIPMCSSAMQHYHMGRILLHIHKPPQTSGPTTIPSQVSTTDIQFHSREIVGIAMACPAGSVRINSLQPLFVSGQCLTDPNERRMVLRLLQDIETDLGWATEYRVKQLLREWGWDENMEITKVS